MIFFILLCFSFINSQDFKLNSEFIYGFESDNEKYYEEHLRTGDFEVGVWGEFNKQKLDVQFHIAYHLIQGAKSKQSHFTAFRGLDWISQDPGLGNKQKNYYISDIDIQYGSAYNNIFFKKWDKHWGPGNRSLTISNKIPTFPYCGINLSINKKIKFEYFHGSLRSEIVDRTYINYYQAGKSLQVARNIAGHRLDWKISDKWMISFSELVIYASRGLDFNYMLPIMPFYPIQNYLNDTDNILMNADLQFQFKKNINIYFSLLVDEWSPPYTFQKDNHNWFGWQFGFKGEKLVLMDDRLQLEYTWTDHRIYHHRFQVNDVYSWGYPVGFWAGPHAQEFFLEYNFLLVGNRIKILYSNAKRGEFTDSMRLDQYSDRPSEIPVYERFSGDNDIVCDDCKGTVESKKNISVKLQRKISDRLEMYIKYSLIHWENAGFEPENPISSDKLDDIEKKSFGFGIKINFN